MTASRHGVYDSLDGRFFASFLILVSRRSASSFAVISSALVHWNGDLSSDLRSEFIDGSNDRSLAFIYWFCVSNQHSLL
jgi:hypothetical protein